MYIEVNKSGNSYNVTPNAEAPGGNSYTWYECSFGNYSTQAQAPWGVIAFFSDATMTEQVPITDLDIGVGYDASLYDFHALFIAANDDSISGSYGIKYEITTPPEIGKGIVVPSSARLAIDDNGGYADGETVFYFQTYDGDVEYMAIIDTTSTVSGSLVWALSEYREAADTSS